jgi:hypothetical protein
MAKNIFCLAVTTAGIALIAGVPLNAVPTNAAVITYNFEVLVPQGDFTGNYPGVLSFDNSTLTNQGFESVPIQTFDFNFAGEHFTEQNLYYGEGVNFFNGIFTGFHQTLVKEGQTPVSEIAFAFGSPADTFEYVLRENLHIPGSPKEEIASYQLTSLVIEQKSVSEPGATWGLGGLGILGLIKLIKKR